MPLLSFLVVKHHESINKRQTLSTHVTNWQCRINFYAFVGQPLSKQLYMKDHILELRRKNDMKTGLSCMYNCDDQSCLHNSSVGSNICIVFIKSFKQHQTQPVFVTFISSNHPLCLTRKQS